MGSGTRMFKQAKLILVTILVVFSALGINGYCRSAYAESAAVSAGEAVMEVTSGRLLFERNADQILPMASTTKILTAIIIIDECDLDAVYEIPGRACGVEGSSIYLVPEEHMTIRDLLYGLMLRSGNDCAEALALYHSNSIEKFVDAMNQKAIQIGANNSCFKNPHGLPMEGHVTTARDLALIATYALRNPIFSEIVSAKQWTIPDGGCGYTRVLQNKNKMLFQYDGADGVKTGFTKKAGRCLVSSATRSGMRLVSVVLNSPQMYERSAEILSDCFANYSLKKLFDASSGYNSIPTQTKYKNCIVGCEQDFFYPLQEYELQEVRIECNLPQNIVLPVKKGDCFGKLDIYFRNQLIFSQKIISIKDVDYSYTDILRDVIDKFLIRGSECG